MFLCKKMIWVLFFLAYTVSRSFFVYVFIDISDVWLQGRYLVFSHVRAVTDFY